MSNKFNGTIYIGVTNNLKTSERTQIKIYPDSFTSKYNCINIYFEEYSKAEEAIVREKRLKKWKRDWKIKLIEDMNPSWVDISDNWNIDFNRLRDER